MKHIKRKWKSIPPKVASKIPHEEIDHEKVNSEMPDGKVLFMIMEDGTNIQTYEYKVKKGESIKIPEPEPILIYFNNAQANLKGIAETKALLIQACKEFNNGVVMGHKVYGFMYHVSTFTIFLFTAIEASINNAIPNDFKYTNKGQIYDLERIQRGIKFADKLKKVLPEATNKNFVQSYPDKYQQILKLKRLRDTLVHTKKSVGRSTYGIIVQEALDFNYAYTILVVRDFINFYYKDFVQECDCGGDY